MNLKFFQKRPNRLKRKRPDPPATKQPRFMPSRQVETQTQSSSRSMETETQMQSSIRSMETETQHPDRPKTKQLETETETQQSDRRVERSDGSRPLDMYGRRYRSTHTRRDDSPATFVTRRPTDWKKTTSTDGATNTDGETITDGTATDRTITNGKKITSGTCTDGKNFTAGTSSTTATDHTTGNTTVIYHLDSSRMNYEQVAVPVNGVRKILVTETSLRSNKKKNNVTTIGS